MKNNKKVISSESLGTVYTHNLSNRKLIKKISNLNKIRNSIFTISICGIKNYT